MANQTTTPSITSRNFKARSVINQRVDEIKPNSPQIFGLTTPLSLAKTRGTLFNQSTDLAIQVIDNFKNMLYTNYGERLGRFDFGANLRSLLAERTSQADWDIQALKMINATTEKYMPYITVDAVETESLPPVNDAISRLNVTVIFSIPKLNVNQRKFNIEVSSIG